MLAKLREAVQIDWSRTMADSASVRAMETNKPQPRGPPQERLKHYLLTDGRGTPLAAIVTGANRHDVTQLLPLVDAVPPVRGKVGRPRRRPVQLYAVRAYDSDPHRIAFVATASGLFWPAVAPCMAANRAGGQAREGERRGLDNVK